MHDTLARDRAEAEGADHAAHVARFARQEAPVGEIDPVGLGVAAQHLGTVGGRVERDRHEADALVELLGAHRRWVRATCAVMSGHASAHVVKTKLTTRTRPRRFSDFTIARSLVWLKPS